MNWQYLIQPKYADNAFVYGDYFIIQYTPDIVSGHIFNLGVAFIQNDTQKLYYRLLDKSLKGFNFIYGQQATDGLRLLLQTLEYALNDVGHLSSPSPHIHYTPLQPIKGFTPQIIIDNLYQDYIHMDGYPQKKTKKPHTLNTSDLRQHLRKNLEQHNKAQYYHTDKIILENDLQKGKIILDLPIWNGEKDLFKKYHLLASIVSADYIDPETLSYNLDFLGCTSVQNACMLLEKKSTKAGIFIYRPTISERITEQILNNINNHIDNSVYQLQRMKQKQNYNITIEVLDNETELINQVTEFID